TDSMSLQNLKKTPLNSIFIKQILDIPVDIDLTPGSVPHLAHLFGKAEKTGRKEKLQWYYYSEGYEKKVSNIMYLRKMTQKARTIYTLFNGIGKDKIEYITYSVDAISSLTETKVCEETLSEAEISITTTPSISSSQISNLEDIEDKVNTSSNLVHNRAYFRNKMEEQYPDLYWEGRDGNNDYYGITDESLCPICKSDHYEDK
ncbi:8998_t:CDS:2, partial [Entrophospora sp. SA101]